MCVKRYGTGCDVREIEGGRGGGGQIGGGIANILGLVGIQLEAETLDRMRERLCGF